MESTVLREPVRTVAEAVGLLAEVGERFRANYQAMLGAVLAAGKPTAVCTIYDAIPDLPAGERTALALFNEVILRTAAAAGLPVIDMRLVCGDPGDYSPLSSIEPSVRGGAKIAERIAAVVAGHDFTAGRCTLYP
jgi:hypothetical protein